MLYAVKVVVKRINFGPHPRANFQFFIRSTTMKYMLWLSAVLACNSFAAQLPSFQAEQATKTLFTDITATDSKVIAVGQHGTIVYSNDGNQWQQAQSPLDLLLTAVFFVDENVGYACGHDASIPRMRR